MRFLLLMQHPQALAALLNPIYAGSQYLFTAPRQLDIHGFSAGSLNGLALHRSALGMAPTFSGKTVVGALA